MDFFDSLTKKIYLVTKITILDDQAILILGILINS